MRDRAVLNAALALMVRGDVRKRWASIAFLAIVFGLAGGLVITSLAAARRASTAVERMLDAAAAWDATIEVNAATLDVTMAAVAADPGVAQHAASAFAPMGDARDQLGIIAGLSPGWLEEIYRPEMIEGRLPAVESADELTISVLARDEFGLGLGDQLVLTDWLDVNDPITVTIVGVHRGPLDLASPSETGNAFASAAFGVRYLRPILAALGDSPDAALARVFVPVRFADGADPQATVARVAAILPEEADVVVRWRADWFARLDSRSGVATTALWLLAVISGLATALLIVATTGRLVASSSLGDQGLRALGLAARDRTVVRAAPAVLVAAGASVVAMLTTVAASPFTAFGPTKGIDPDDGIWIDTTVLALGVPALFGLCTLAGIAWSARAGSQVRPERVIATRVPLPVATRLATNLARSRAGRGPLALAAVATGVAILTAVSIYHASERRLLGEPALFGADFDAIVYEGDDLPIPPWGFEIDDPRLSAVTLAQGTVVDVNGSGHYALVMDPRRGSAGGAVLNGRAPVASDEVLLGVELLDSLDLEVGDTIEVTGGTAAPFRIVGSGLVPQLDAIPFGGGVWFAPGAIERAGIEIFQSVLLVKTPPGARPLDGYVEDTAVPDEIRDLGNINGLPELLGAMGAVLGLVVLAFVVSGILRSRTRDMATVRALGGTVNQMRLAGLTTAVVLVVPGLVIGLALGVAVGSRFWARVAQGLPVVERVDVPGGTLIVVAVGTLVVASLVAIGPALMIGRRTGADALRRE